MFELYNYENKMPKDKYNKIYKILINNFYKNNNEIIKDEKYNNWVNMILNTPNYYILIYSINNNIVGFISCIYIEEGLMLSEVQIKKQYQGKYDILRKMLKYICNICDKDKSKYVLGTINDNNEKSKQVFTYIGFKKEKGILYKISFNNLIKWINK